MTIEGDRYIVATDLSEAWADAITLVSTQPSRKAVHVLVRILDPAHETPAIRQIAQDSIDIWNGSRGRKKLPDIVTTRNTIFPAAFAGRTAGPEALAAYYRDRYSKAGLLGFKNNERGTYFGRVVAYPRPAGGAPGDQLSDTVRKLRQELAGQRPKSSRYEINIYHEATDRSPMSFPCLAHLSVHLHEHRLHLQAIYRNESLVSRAYGNFLGLAQLQCYIADAVGIAPGELLVTAGHIELEGTARFVQNMVAKIASQS